MRGILIDHAGAAALPKLDDVGALGPWLIEHGFNAEQIQSMQPHVPILQLLSNERALNTCKLQACEDGPMHAPSCTCLASQLP